MLPRNSLLLTWDVLVGRRAAEAWTLDEGKKGALGGRAATDGMLTSTLDANGLLHLAFANSSSTERVGPLLLYSKGALMICFDSATNNNS